jgi:hypothetical protein
MTSFGSSGMRLVAAVSETTWADEQPALTPFSFILLLPEADSIPWWQYLHARFPVSLGWSTDLPPSPLPVYIDTKRWSSGTRRQTFELVVTSPRENFDWSLLGDDSVLVIRGTGTIPKSLRDSFVSVIQKEGHVICVGYNGTPASMVGLVDVEVPVEKLTRKKIGISPSDWRNFLNYTKWN